MVWTMAAGTRFQNTIYNTMPSNFSYFRREGAAEGGGGGGGGGGGVRGGGGGMLNNMMDSMFDSIPEEVNAAQEAQGYDDGDDDDVKGGKREAGTFGASIDSIQLARLH